MHFGTKLLGIARTACRKIGQSKKLAIPVFAIAIVAIGFGIFTAVRALTPVNTNVGISSNRSYRGYYHEGYPIYYGINEHATFKPWSTYWYGIDVDQDGSYDHDAMCLQASKHEPWGSGPALQYSNSLETRLKRVMLATIPSYSAASVASGGPNYYALFKSSYNWDGKTAGVTNLRTRDANIRYDYDDDRAQVNSNGEEIVKYVDYYYGCSHYYDTNCNKSLSNSKVNLSDAIFAVGHMMASGIYSNDYYAVSGQSTYLSGIADDIEAWFASNYPDAHEEYQVYISYISNSDTQTVGWLEYKGPSTISAYIKIRKADSITGTVTNGSLTVQGTVFSILNSSNVEVGTITIDANGVGTSPALDAGTYTIKEKTATTGYNVNNAAITVTITRDDNNKTIDLSQSSTACTNGASFNISSSGCTFKNDAIRNAKIKIKKVNSENSTVSYAGLSVVGTVFSVKDSSNTEVTTITIGNDGTGTTANVLGAGTYTITEKTVTTGYNTNGAKLTVTLRDSDLGTTTPVIDYSTSNTACTTSSTSPCWFYNDPIKGKISLTKKGYELSESGSATTRNLSGIYFTATNQNDTSITYTIGPTATDGTITSPNMVYGTYKAKELRQAGSNNNAYKLLEFNFEITSSGDNSSTISIVSGTGTSTGGALRDDIPDNPGLSTVARNSLSTAASPNKEIEISGTAGVTDKITCSGLESGAEYKLEGTLWDKAANGQVKISRTGSTYVTGTNTFTADASGKCNGNTGIDMVFDTFDSSAYMDKTLAIKQVLFKNNGTTSNPDWVRIFIHNSGLTDTNEEVKVRNIEITTVANSERSNNKELAAGTVKIVDTYNIVGLVNGQTYTLKGYVKDGTTTVATATDSITMNLATGATYSSVMNFTFDSTPYVGKSLTVVQELYMSGVSTPIATHSTDDGTQTVTVIVPTIGTSAVNNRDTSSKELEVGHIDTTNGSPTIKDTVTYTGLVPGDIYTIKGEVWKIGGDGHAETRVATQSHSFTASSENSTAGETITFEVDTISNCAVNNKLTLPCKFVVYEYIYFANNASPFAKHEDANDANQTVSVKTPAITTTATDIQNDTKLLPLGTTTVMDKVTYTNLMPGQTYILEGKLIDLSNGHVATNSSGVEVTAREQFTAAASSAPITIDSFKTFDTVLQYDYSLGANQKKYVVYQTLYSGDIELYSHQDNNDPDQMVQIGIPRMITSATYKLDGSHLLGVGDVTMKDYVDYEGLVEGEWYMIVGTMVDPETGTPVEINDEFVRNTKTFKAGTKGKGTVELEINLNTISLQGRKFVVFERLYRSEDKHGDGRLLAIHEPEVDADEQTITVKIASIGTVASDKVDGDNILDHEDGQIIVDKVHYDGLLMDEDYILYGYLYDKTNHAPLKDSNGDLITSTATFTTPTRRDNGDIEMEFNVDAHDLPGTEIVVFEYLFQGSTVPTNPDGTVNFDEIVTKHADEDNPDPSQTVRVSMRVGTTAADDYDGDKTIGVGKVKVIDNLQYEGATMGKTYKAKGWLVYKTAGDGHDAGDKVKGIEFNYEVRPCTDSTDEPEDGEEEGEDGEGEEECTETIATPFYVDIEGEKVFVVGSAGYESTNGTVTITFEFDSRLLIGEKLVVFEELYLVDDEGHEELVAEHKDLEDDDQTVIVATPTIHTIAVDKSDNDKELANNTEVTIKDTVEYTGLAAGTTYTLYGTLVDKNTGERVSGGLTEVTWTFTPTRDAGSEEMEFTINTTGISGKELVVFETLYIGEEIVEDYEIAEHKDLNDDSQTVWVKVERPNTGIFTHTIEEAKKTSLYTAVCGVTVLVVCGWVASRVVKHNKIRRF